MLPKHRLTATFGIVLLAVTASACGGRSGSAADAGGTASAPPAQKSSTGKSTTAGPTATKTARAKPAHGGPRVKIAFGGDVHFAGSSAAALSGDLGTAVPQLTAADLSVVNLETAITNGGTAAPKQYTFRAPPRAMEVLHRAGIDVVTVANNHGMDYGRTGLTDTLAASKRYDLPIIGAGADITAAYTPYRTTIHGVRVSVLAATDVLDAFATNTWPATADEPGLASVKNPARLLAAVRTAAATSDVVAVDLHWGVELRSCPTPRQLQLARLLTAAGADIVVGSHAHVLGPHEQRGSTAVDFGLGNFIFYASGSGLSTQSGVFTVTADRGGVVSTRWSPATISGGRPQLLSGSSAETASSRENALARSCGLN